MHIRDVPRLTTLLLSIILLASVVFVVEADTQRDDRLARVAQWDAYAMPDDEFGRYVDLKKGFWLWRPSKWIGEASRDNSFVFSAGPEGPTISVITDEIPDGYGIANYVTSMLQQFRQHRIRTETIIVRHIMMGGVEGRELTFELEPPGGNTVRETFWVTAVGPRVYALLLVVKPEEQERYEPYLKRMALSFGIGAAGHWNEEFETLRARLTQATPAGAELAAAQLATRLHAAQTLRSELLGEARTLAARAPGEVFDLLTHSDPQVRSFASAALGGGGESSGVSIDEALIWALHDPDLYCSAAAAQALAGRGATALTAIRAHLTKLSEKPETIIRLGAALDAGAANDLAGGLLRSENAPEQLAGLGLAIALPLEGLDLPYGRLLAERDDRVREALIEAIRVRRPANAASSLLAIPASGETEVWAVRALGEVAEISLAERYEKRINEIDKRLGVVVVTAKPIKIPKKAAKTGSPFSPPPMTMEPGKNSDGTPIAWGKLSETMRLGLLRGALYDASQKIRLRDRWNRAGDEAARFAIRQEITKEESPIQNWAQSLVSAANGAVSWPTTINASLKDAPTDGATIFPARSSLYLQAPNFARTLTVLDDALSGVQMGTVRDQMTFALILRTLKAQLAEALEVQGAMDLGTSLGIDLSAPISMATWPVENGREQTSRGAVLLRVKEPARLERLLAYAQKQAGDLTSIITIGSSGARFAGLAPALVPIIFAAGASNSTSASRLIGGPFRGAAASADTVFLRREKIGEVPVTIIEKISVTSGPAPRQALCIAYLGSTALITSSRAALAEALAVASGGAPLGASDAFKRLRAETGELVFFSRLGALFTELSGSSEIDRFTGSLADALGIESGALQLNASTWETVFHLQPGESKLVSSLRPFTAADLSAPSQLLPRGTILYAGTVIDPPQLWAALRELNTKTTATATEQPKKDAPSEEPAKVATLNANYDEEIEREILPALAGEVALAIVSLRPILSGETADWPSLAGAFKLKDKSLAERFRAGRLFASAERIKGEMALGSPIVALGHDAPYLIVTEDYLVIAESIETMRRLAAPEKFAATEAYARSTTNLPTALRFFATYNLEAAYEETKEPISKNDDLARLLPLMSAVTHAFHSQRAFLTFNEGQVEGRLSVAFDRAGRYAVGAVARGVDEFDVANAIIAPKGLSLTHAPRVETLKLKMTARQDGAGVRLRDDLSIFAHQRIEASDERSVLFESSARRIPEGLTVKLPVAETGELAPYLRSTPRINARAPQIVELAQQIAGKDRDGRSVARKLGAWTYANLKWKRVSSDTVETLASREADCLEHAELYVALARALGLPARVASGAAFSGGAFGAHAWVEVHLGRWVELDPTWGLTDYVDATHLRFADDTFASYVMLNQVDLEVVAARTSIAEFQRRPQDLLRALASGGEEKKSGRELVFDLPLAITQIFGPGAWEKFDAKQREAISRAFDRATAEQLEDWSADAGVETRLLREEIKGDRATLLTLRGADLMRLTLALRDGAWYVVEVEDLDSAIPIFSQSLRGAIDPRADRWHLLALDPDRALKRYDELIAVEGENAPLLTLKAMALGRRQFAEMLNQKSAPDEKAPEKPDEANAHYTRIIERWPDFAPAYYLLASRLSADEKDGAQKIKLLERYAQLVPLDPRPWHDLAVAFEALNQPVRVESAYREAIARDRTDHSLRVQLAVFNLRQSQLEKAKISFAEAIKEATAKQAFELLNDWVLSDLEEEAEPEVMARYEALLLAFPKELATSSIGLCALAQSQQAQKKTLEAIKSIERAIGVKPTAEDYIYLAQWNRELKRWRLALAAADQGVKLEKDSVTAHLERAYALVQLNRAPEAITALKRALELLPELRESLAESEELKPIAALPAFKALVAAPAKPAEKP